MIVQEIDIDRLIPMEDVRLTHDAMKDEELLRSIKEWGIRLPILTRPHPDPELRARGKLQIIDGRRRTRIGREAGLSVIPGEVREMDDEEAYTMAIVPSLQREDIDNRSMAHWISLLEMKFNWKQKKIAEKTGKSQAWVSQMLAFWEDIMEAQKRDKKEPLPRTERQARAIRGMSEGMRQRVLAAAEQTGEIPYSGRELERLSRAQHTPEEVLRRYRKSQDDEFVAMMLIEDAGLTMSDAKSVVSRWKLDLLPWQRKKKPPLGDYKPNASNKQVQLYSQLSKYFPVEVIDAVDTVAPARSLETAIRNCRRFVAKLFNKATPELRQSALEEFKL